MRMKNCTAKMGIAFIFVLCSLMGNTALAQQATVQGTVTDSQTGETMPGVNVIIKGTTTGTATSSDGTYSMVVSSLSDTLMVSFIGYQTQEVPINGRTEIDIQLVPKA